MEMKLVQPHNSTHQLPFLKSFLLLDQDAAHHHLKQSPYRQMSRDYPAPVETHRLFVCGSLWSPENVMYF